METDPYLVSRLIQKGLISFRAPIPEAFTPKKALPPSGPPRTPEKRAYDAERQRRRFGYKEWRARGPGRPPIDRGFCKWCGGQRQHTAGCKRPGA